MSEKLPPDSQGKIIVFGAKEIRRAWVDGEWFFSVVDVVGALTDSAAPAKYWDAMKRREKESSGIDLSTICRKVKLTGADGKTYNSQAVNTEAAFGLTPTEYKKIKGLKRENLRDHMTDLELIFTMLGEASTTEIARNRDAQGFIQNKTAARDGGTVAGNARRQLEAKSGRNVVTRTNYLTDKPRPRLPPTDGSKSDA